MFDRHNALLVRKVAATSYDVFGNVTCGTIEGDVIYGRPTRYMVTTSTNNQPYARLFDGMMPVKRR